MRFFIIFQFNNICWFKWSDSLLSSL